jgi:hypothetical protein
MSMLFCLLAIIGSCVLMRVYHDDVANTKNTTDDGGFGDGVKQINNCEWEKVRQSYRIVD